jgi:lipopolysaccharide transport protein LptA
MRRDRARLARRALAGLVVLVAVAVAWSLRRPGPAAGTQAPPAAAAQGTTVDEGSLLRFEEGRQKVAVRWRTMAGQEGDAMKLQGVEVSLPFTARGRDATATISADECLYQPAPLRASFRGNVKVRTDDGFELDSASLKYWGEEERAFTRDAVSWKRGTASGTASGLEYRTDGGLSLHGPVTVRLEEGAGPPTEVESGSAWASRDERLVRFEGGVVVRQGARVLRSGRLQLNLDEALSAVERAAAIEDVELDTPTGATGPGAGASGGEKRLRCRRLNMTFREKGVLHEAIAVNRAALEVEPGPGEAQEARRVTAHQLRFAFDEEGRLASVEGRAGRPADRDAARQVVLTTEPRAGGRAVARRVESQSFQAALDPASGALNEARFAGSVAFSEPGRKAWAGQAHHDERTGLLRLEGDPRILDEGDGGELRGKVIRVFTRSRDVAASGSVRHTVGRRGRPARPGVLAGGEDAVLLCDEFEYDAAKRTARYRESALLRSGRDEVRAPTIVIEEAPDGRRRLQASGGTTSRLHPRPSKGATGEPRPVEARSREMVYEEAQGRIVYTGDVEIRQGDILTRSPEAVVTLGRESGTVERVAAGEPVEVQQGPRRATGQRGTYTPENETFVLVGEKVVLEDVDRRLEGRILTFEVGGDRIRVDGREEVRTEAVFKRKERPTP